MLWSFFALGISLALCALGVVMNRNGRKADRERAGRGCSCDRE